MWWWDWLSNSTIPMLRWDYELCVCMLCVLVVYLDVSEVSMSIAQSRAAVLGLSGISWYADTILRIPELGLGRDITHHIFL